MFSGERPRSENLEEGNSHEIALSESERVASGAISAVKIRDAADPVISSTWLKKAQNFLETAYEYTPDSIKVAPTNIAKMFWGLLKFAGKIIQKKGNVGFGEGYKIGQEIFEEKKDKK